MFLARVKMDGVLVCQSKLHESKRAAAVEALDLLNLGNLPMTYADPLIIELFYRDDR